VTAHGTGTLVGLRRYSSDAARVLRGYSHGLYGYSHGLYGYSHGLHGYSHGLYGYWNGPPRVLSGCSKGAVTSAGARLAASWHWAGHGMALGRPRDGTGPAA
jgi:hypothetical protein